MKRKSANNFLIKEKEKITTTNDRNILQNRDL